MKELAFTLSLAETNAFRLQCLQLADDFPYFLFLDSCLTTVDQYGSFMFTLGVADENAQIARDWQTLETNLANRLWMGGLSYELKNRFEPTLMPAFSPRIPFPEVGFFVPQFVVECRRFPDDRFQITVKSENPEIIVSEIRSKSPTISTIKPKSPDFHSNFSRERYIETVEQLREHIAAGDVYEINLTQEFLAENVAIQPVELFVRLTEISPTPFASLFRFDNFFLIGSSPERFLRLENDWLVSQPIKGTTRRSDNAADDERLKNELINSEKERSENVMIVDLTRNDLHRSCQTNTVRVPELFGVQTFRQLHHLVSTVSGMKRPEVGALQAVRNAFPPGSMTGAPKVAAMRLINQYEQTGRGLYSGSVGYISNAGFDFNVVIRSLIYDASSRRLSYHVGGAITYESSGEAEYEESLLKAKAIRRLFE